MSGGKNMATSETKLEALKIQSSAYGVVIPVIGGVNRIAGNLVDYLGFKATPHTSTQDQGGKGGGVKTTNTTYTYSASVLMGICHGPIGGISRIWKGKEVLAGGWSAANIVSAFETYVVPASGAMTYTLVNGATLIGAPTITTAIAVTEGYGDAGGSWVDTRVITLANGTDYSLSGGVVTVLDAKWRGYTLSLDYQRGNGAPNQTPLTTLGLALAAGDLSQTAPAWLTALDATHSLGYPGLALVHGQDYDLGTGASVDNHSFEVQGSGAYRYGSTKPDCNPAEFAAGILTDGRYGAGMPAGQLEVGDWKNYCAAAGLLMSPLLTEQQRAADFIDAICKLTNSAAVWSVDTLKIIPYGDVTLTANGVTYTPNTTPLYDLNDDRWLQDGSEDPIIWTDKAGADRYNVVRVEYCDRSMYYAKTIAEAQDDADIAANGKRVMPTFTAPWICDAGVARLVAQILLQRSLLIGREASIKLPWAYCMLEPMDLVTVSDTLLNDSKLPVRITKIEEDEEGTLTVEIEDWPLGAASPTAYTSQVPGGYLHNYRAAPGSVQTPVFFEAPAVLTSTGLEVYAAVKGAGADWGGCSVWVSSDGLTYKRIGSVAGPARYGTLSAAMTATQNTAAVQGLGSSQLLSGSAADAVALNTLCYIGGASPEYVAYTTATLTSAGAYSLTGVLRGAHGKAAAAHASGDAFVRVDDALARSGELTPDTIGKTLYFKFTSFNTLGGAEEDLAAVTAYTYTVQGTFYSRTAVDKNLLANTRFRRLRGTMPYPYDPEGWAVYNVLYTVGGKWAPHDRPGRDGATDRSIAIRAVAATDPGAQFGRVGFVTSASIQDPMVTGGIANGWRPGETYTVSLWARVWQPGGGGSVTQGLWMNGTLAAGGDRSYMMARISRATGLVTFARTYDVWGVGSAGAGLYYSAANLAADLNATGSDSIVVVWTADNPLDNRLTSGLPAALYRCGATAEVFASASWQGRSAYQLIGIPDSPSQGYERYIGALTSDPSAVIDTRFDLVGAGGALVPVVRESGAHRVVSVGYGLTVAATPTKAATAWNGKGAGLYWNMPPAAVENVAAPGITNEWQQYKYRVVWGAIVEPSGNLYWGVGDQTGATVLASLPAGAVLEMSEPMVSLGSDFPAHEASPADDLREGSIGTNALSQSAVNGVMVLFDAAGVVINPGAV